MFYRPTWAEVDLGAIEHNIRAFKKYVANDVAIMAVVKANAYGHGAVPVAEAAIRAGATHLAVASVEEGIELRQKGITAPILILGVTPPAGAEAVVSYELSQAVFQRDVLIALSQAAQKLGKRASVHVKIDTGMGRIGLTHPAEAVDFVRQAADLPGIWIEGIFSHLATADEEDKSYMWEQVRRWNTVMKALEQAGIHIPLRHLCNSAAAIEQPELHQDMVRIGIAMYGIYPSRAVRKDVVALRPALSFKTRIAHIKSVSKGQFISYGATYQTEKEERIATISVGYADGYSRHLSNRGFVLVGGKRCPIVGRICMDQCMVNVTGVPAKVGDEVVLYGSQGEESISLDEVASWIGTISYEITCVLNKRVPRIYMRDGKIVGSPD